MPGITEKKRPTVNPYGGGFGGRLAEWIDDAIYFLSPKWGTRRRTTRLRNELMKSRVEKLGVSWTRPNVNRDSNWFAHGLSIDNVMYHDVEQLQNRCAELYRTNDVAHACVEARIVNEVGCGIKPQARVVDDDNSQDSVVNAALEEAFYRWSKYGVDVGRAQNIFEFQRMADRSLAIFGEAIIVLSDTPSESGITTTCELISPERLSTPPGMENDPNIQLGVQLSDSGRVIGYWIRTQHPGAMAKNYEYKWDYYPRFDERGQPRVLHVYERAFAGQHRGIPWMAAALDRIKDLDDWFEAELIAKQVEACFGLIFTGGEQSASAHERALAQSSGVVYEGRQLEELQPGMIHYANDGEEVKTIDPQRPGATFAPFVEQTLRSIAASLNIPYEVISKNFFRTTFSSGQLAMLDGRHGFKARRQLMVDGFLVPLWGRFVDDAVFNDEVAGTIDGTLYVASPEPYKQHVWVAPGWGFINPRDEVRAATEALESDITTLSTLYAERGEDADTQLRKRQEERLRDVRDSVERRKVQWELEEEYGLPHMESEPQEETDVNDETEVEASREESDEQAAAGA